MNIYVDDMEMGPIVMPLNFPFCQQYYHNEYKTNINIFTKFPTPDLQSTVYVFAQHNES